MINIHARVKHLIQKYGTRDPEKIINYLGIDLRYEDIGEKAKGFYISLVTNKYIVINNKLDEHEKNIVLAHELGHALLHYHKSTCYLREYTLFPRGRIENEANKFAAELLIDEKNIEKCYIEGMSINQLSCYYGVPKQLVEYKFNKYK
ncbi:ImmA/IrrE family metallo-endopeptidase [Clostridium tyrobutyricum]|uniref:ImmA/IrrE family metallo-endopeptidase n=1 Tax=Clostridium tyrobutyricum TaxID=1519 RepID=UPI001C37FE7E|nr:ImmA/IrrE family metallo-endopeptidase [Clostridium tyrobutyricum]MBV4426486.1 ImmA/IrrE family metallo-endopeptidase [Clostridium tyrobutyricum]MBV4436721.1 ImmA/IrrE family metallo-endopeptidase [Clostridium tyrobutyricum]MBV4439410.1 ImmA/IrrE family metallo-endopeptidase [Clostridium tyrobutyricum]